MTATDNTGQQLLAPDTHMTVHQALARVAAELPAIGKNDRGPANQGGYAYRGIEAIITEAAPLLAKYGVVIVPRVRVDKVVPSPGMKDGWQDTYITVRWRIYGPDGSRITAVTTGVGRDNVDKGVNKAQSQAFKYLLLPLLGVADKKDDADGQHYDEGRYTPPPPEPPAWEQLGWPSEQSFKAAHDTFLEATKDAPDVVRTQLRQWRGEQEGLVWRGGYEPEQLDMVRAKLADLLAVWQAEQDAMNYPAPQPEPIHDDTEDATSLAGAKRKAAR